VQDDAPDNSVGCIGHVIVIGGPMFRGAFEDQHPVSCQKAPGRTPPQKSNCKCLVATLLAPAKFGNFDFDFTDCCAQRLRLAADCPASDRQQFITDFRADAGNLIIFYRPVDQVKRSQVIHGWPLTQCFAD
jgi:hypothetical protein